MTRQTNMMKNRCINGAVSGSLRLRLRNLD